MKKIIHWIKDQLPGIIITVTIGWFITIASIQESEPQFLVDGIRSVIIDKETLNGQPIIILKTDGKEITKDLVTATFYFYNSGQKPIIGKNDVVNNLKIVLNDSTGEILNYKILKLSREDIGVILSKDTVDKMPSLNLKFQILEQNDGFTGQVTYIGNPNASIKLTGTIIGKKDINEYKLSLLDNIKLLFHSKILILITIIIFVVMLLTMAAYQYFRYYSKKESEIILAENKLRQEIDEFKKNDDTNLDTVTHKINNLFELSRSRISIQSMQNPFIITGLFAVTFTVMGLFYYYKGESKKQEIEIREVIMKSIPDEIRP